MFEECLYFNSNALARTLTRNWTEAYKPFGLSPPHAFLLRVVLAQPGLLQRQLADELGLSRSTITRFVDSLEKREFLHRKPAGEDGREIEIHPAPKATALHRQLDATGAAMTTKMKQLFGDDEVATTLSMLRRMREHLE